LDLGGAERLLVSAAQVADYENFQYSAAYVLPSRAGAVSDLESMGVATYCLGSDHHLDLRWAGRLRRLLRSQKFDVLHTHLPYVQPVGSLVAHTLPRGERPHLIYTQHNMWYGTRLPSRLANRITLGLNEAIIAVSNTAREGTPRSVRTRTEVVVHGVTLDDARAAKQFRQEVRSELGVGDDEVLVTSVANFRPEKGHSLLLAAAQQVINQGLPVRFAVVGHGPLETEIRSLHAQLGLSGRVNLLGLRRDVFRILAASDVYVLSSLHEGFPVSIMEALVMGLPVVTTAVGGVLEALRDGVEGLVVPPGRSDLLADALARVVRDSDLRSRLTEGAKKRGDEFDVTTAVRRMENLYRELVDGWLGDGPIDH
jgi:glycosyltransferase involved in cell wall biosynthesis